MFDAQHWKNFVLRMDRSALKRTHVNIYNNLKYLRRHVYFYLVYMNKNLIRIILIFRLNHLSNICFIKLFVVHQKVISGSGGIRTHASEETGALNQRLRPLGHATSCWTTKNQVTLWASTRTKWWNEILNFTVTSITEKKMLYKIYRSKNACYIWASCTKIII